MASGGYKIAKYTFTGDGSAWNGSTSAVEITATMKQNCRTILIGCAKALMQANPQWEFDTDMPSVDTGNITVNTTDLDLTTALPRILECYLDRSGSNRYNYSCGVYFVNSVTNTKIALIYFANLYKDYYTALSSVNTGSPFYASNCSILIRHPVGLSIAMMPFESQQTWSSYDWSSDNWCKSSMVAPMSCNMGSVGGGSNYSSMYNNAGIGISNTVDVQYSWSFICKEDDITVILKASNWSYTNSKGFIIGKLFDNFHEEDVYHYGAFHLMRDIGTNTSREQDNNTTANNSSDTKYFNPLSNYYTSNKASNAFILHGTALNKYNDLKLNLVELFNSNGNIKGGISENLSDINSTSNASGTCLVSCAGLAALCVESEKARFIQLGIGLGYPNATKIYGQDQFKGWIKSDLLRIIYNPLNIGSYISGNDYPAGTEPFARGRTFDNGDFIYIGGGLCLGWDSSNTLSPFDNNMPA